MSDSNGGPAFPTLEEHGFNSGMPGMTLHDYFMAHAPAEPQSWFQPVMPPATTFPCRVPNPTEEEQQELHGLGDWLGVEDCRQPRVKEYAMRLQKSHQERAAWDRLCMRERYTQWPAAWADTQLEARK